MGEKIAPDNEVVTRFVKDKNKISKLDKRVRYNAFIDKRFPHEISVLCIKDLLEGKQTNFIWELSKHVFPEDWQKTKARADIPVGALKKLQDELEVIIDGKPIERHANIKYKSSAREISKALAIELVELAKHHFKPDK